MFVVYRVQLRLGVKREAATGRTLVVPWVIGFLVFNVFAIGASLYLSFTDYNLVQQPRWIGLDNYRDLFTLNITPLESADQRTSEVLPRGFKEVQRITVGDGGFVFSAKQEDFWRAIRLTLPFAFLSVPAGMISALGVALLLNQKVRLLGLWRVLYYMPAILPVVATALLWRWIFAPNAGLINNLLAPLYNLLGWETPRWFTDPNLALPAFVLVSMWGAFGANSVVLLAGLKGIPKELYEAADIDGAGEWAKFRNVTIPMLSPALFYNLVTGTIAALQVFEFAAFIPTTATIGTFVNWQIYQEAFTFREMGLASAEGWILLVIILALTALVFRSSQAWVFYQGAREEAA
ncbi:MAG: sugar ABC transporter permease [Anaerolineae bacterium]|nr:sugar ABC transporter permease [Anaerolineae bacterium]